MSALGLKQSVMTTRFVASDPTTIQDGDALDRAIPIAELAGLQVSLAVYPYPPREVEDGTATPSGFAAWLTLVAQRYPTVKQFIVMNEPNQPAFMRPQFGPTGKNVSAARTGAFLAAGYDALKAVDPTIRVIGLGLSPRGNDQPTATSNVSTSPVRFLAALGAWYRSSGRTLPLMDDLSFHPYPDQAIDPIDRGYRWPKAGFANLDRIKQSIWDAFRDTPQPTTVSGLKLYLDEVGWQVDTSTLTGYTGTENVRVTDDSTQARSTASSSATQPATLRSPRSTSSAFTTTSRAIPASRRRSTTSTAPPVRRRRRCKRRSPSRPRAVAAAPPGIPRRR